MRHHRHARSLPKHRPGSSRHATVFFTSDGKVIRSTRSGELHHSSVLTSKDMYCTPKSRTNYVRKIDNFGEMWDENDLEVQQLTCTRSNCQNLEAKFVKAKKNTLNSKAPTDAVRPSSNVPNLSYIESNIAVHPSSSEKHDFSSDATIEYKASK